MAIAIALTLFGGLCQHIRRGDMVRVQASDGSWHNRLVAVGLEGDNVVVAEEGAWVAVQAEQREPVSAIYPAERVHWVSEE